MVDYSAAIQSVDSSDRAAAKSLLSDGSPDDAARAFQLERASGVPASDINQDIPSFEQTHSAQLSKMLIDNNPYISDFIASHPLHGQLVKDDIGNLDAYTQAYRRIAPGGHPFGQFLQGFFEQFQGPEEIKRRAEERWNEKIPDYPWLAKAGAHLLGIPSEMAFREPILGLLEGSRKALKAFYVNSGVGSDQDADRFANEWVDLLGYQLMKPEVKLAIQPGPLRGEILPPEARPPEPPGLPRPPTTIEAEVPPTGPTDLTRRGFLQGVASVAASRAVPSVVGKALEGLHPNAAAIARDYFADHVTGLPVQSRAKTIETLQRQADIWGRLKPSDALKSELRQQFEDGLITEEEMTDRLGPGMSKAYSDAAKLLQSGWTPKPEQDILRAFANREADVIRPYLEAGERPPSGVSDIIDEIEAHQTEASQKATDEVIKARDQTALAQRSPEKLEEFTRGLPVGTTRIGIEAFDKVPPEKFDWIPNLESRLAQGPASISVSTNLYIAKIDKDIHKEIKEFVSHGEDLSPAEVKELKESKALRAEQEAPEQVSSAAIRIGDDIYSGRIHSDAAAQAHEKYGDLAYDPTKVEDGYVTTKGRFVNREEALSIAEQQRQLSTRGALRVEQDRILAPQLGTTTGLQSEDLALQTARDAAGLKPIVTYAEFLELEDVTRLLDMVVRKASPEEFMADPFIKKFMEEQDKSVLTATKEQARDPAWRENRTYVWHNQPIKGNAIIDKIIADATEGRSIKHDKVLTLVTGPPGAGKSSITDPLAKELGAAVINSDAAKDLIPEYRGGQGIYAVHRESVALAEAAIDRLMDQGANIMIEKLGNNYQDISPQIEAYKQLGYKVNLVHVGAPLDVITPRIVERFIRTGRIVALTHAASVVDKTYPGYEKLKEVINGSAAAYDTTDGFPARLVDGAGTEIARSMEAGGGGRDGPPVPPREGGPPEDPRRKRIFAKAKAFGRTEREYSAYERLIADRDAEDVEWRLKRAQKQADRENSQAWKDEAKRITSEVRDEISTRPEIQAYRFFQDGEVFGQKLPKRPKISGKDLTDEQRAVLPPKFVTGRGGYTPDAVANLFGFDDGNSLVSAIASMEREAGDFKGDIVDRLTSAEVERRVNDKLGETAQERLDEVTDHALSITQLEMLHEQMLRLGTQIGAQIPLTRDATRLGALNLLHQETFGGMSSRRYRRDSDRAFRRLEKALLAEDPNEAFKNAQQQSISAEVATEARQVEKETKVFDRLQKRYRKREVNGRDAEFTNWIHNLLNQIGEGTRSQADIDTEIGASAHTTFQSFLDSKAAQGREIYVAEHLLDPTYSKPLEEQSVLEARRTMETLRSLDKVSRDENRLEVAGQKRDRKEILDQMAEQLEKLGPATNFAETLRGAWTDSPYQAVRKTLRTYVATTLQIESLLNRWDRGNAFGIFNQWIGRPLIEAANYEAKLQREIGARYRDLPDKLTKDELNKQIPNTIFKQIIGAVGAWKDDGTYDWDSASPQILTRKNLRAILLNVGNQSNLSKLAKGYGLKPEVVMDWLNTYATKEDWDWAQAHGNIFEDLKKESDVVYRNMSGVAPEKVELTPIQTKFGTYQGWYHPLIYNTIVDGTYAKPEIPSDLFGREYNRPNTPASYTKARTNYTAPLSLSLEHVPSRFQQEIHDIAFHAPIVNASKIIYDSRFQNLVTKYYGKEYANLFKPWLKDIANAKNYTMANQEVWDTIQSALRQNIQSVLIGFNPRTIQKHGLTALMQSITDVGPARFFDALLSMTQSNERGVSNWQFVSDMSEEVARRHQNAMEQVAGAQKSALEGGSLRDAMLYYGTAPVALADALSTRPLWLAYYRKGLEEGKPPGDVIYEADRAVRRTHGSSAITSRPQVQRNWPWIASFYGFVGHVFQRQWEIGWQLRDLLSGKETAPGTVGNIAAGLFSYILFFGAIDYLVSDYNDKESFSVQAGKAIIQSFTSPLWGIREAVHAAMNKGDPSWGLAATDLKTVTDTIKDLNLKSWSTDRRGKTIKHLTTAFGAATGWTNAEIGNLAEFIVDLNSGKAKPRTASEWWRGLTKGEIRQREPRPDLIERGLRAIEGGRR